MMPIWLKSKGYYFFLFERITIICIYNSSLMLIRLFVIKRHIIVVHEYLTSFLQSLFISPKHSVSPALRVLST